MKHPIPFSHFIDSDLPSIKSGPGQSVVRLRPDLYGYVMYMASISRKSSTEIIDDALRFAFQNATYSHSEVYDINYGTQPEEEDSQCK